MAQVMDPHIGQTQFGKHAMEPPSRRAPVEWSSELVREDQVRVVPLATGTKTVLQLFRPTPTQGIDGEGREGERAMTCLTLRLSQNRSFEN